MAKRIGNQSYPEDVMVIMADRELGKLFRAFVKSRLGQENTDFLDAVAKQFDPEKLYPKFIDINGDSAITVTNAARKAATELADANDFKNSEWTGIMRDLCKEIEFGLQRNFVTDFWRYKPFLEFHRTRAEKLNCDPRKAAELLSVPNTRTI